MPIGDVDTPRSPGWWFKTLANEQKNRRKRLDCLWERYEGRPPLPELTSEAATVAQRRMWEAFQRKSRTNYAELVVEAVRERMTLLGFRTGATGDENGDPEARKIWVGNDLPVESADVHEMFLGMGDSYTIAGPPEEGSEIPVITGEDPRQCITAHDPVRQSKVLAGLKWYWDLEEEQDVAYVHIPGEVHVARRVAGQKSTVLGENFRFSPKAWTWDDEPINLARDYNVNRVTITRFRNRRGVGEFENHVDLLDRINHMLLQRMVIATMQAFKQRAIKGIPVNDPKTGKPIDYSQVFTADPGALWLLPATAEMWESGQVDLQPLLSAVKDDVRDLAAVTRTSLSLLAPENASAEGAVNQREGAVFKAEDRLTRAGGGWRHTMSLAFEFRKDKARADMDAIEVLWKPVERFSMAERYSANVQAKAGDVPWRTRMTDILGFDPDQVARMEQERTSDLLYAPDQPVQ